MITKPNIQKTSAEALSKIKNRSPYAMPNNPSAVGWSADDIKRAFWEPLLAEDVSVMKELSRVVDEINAYLDAVYAHVGSGNPAQIDAAYAEFVLANESGLTGLANATWRILKDHLERFRAQAQEIAQNVQTVRELAQEASAGATEAKRYADSAATAKEAAKVSETNAQTSAEQAALAVETIAEYQGMHLDASLTCYAQIRFDGKLVFGISKYSTSLHDGDNGISLGGFELGAAVAKNDLLPLMRDDIFSCRMVEIMIAEPYAHPFNEDVYYRERVGGCKTIATNASKERVDGNGEGYTRLIQARTIEAEDVGKSVYYLKLSASLADAIRKAVAYGAEFGGAWAEKVPVVFNGYN